MSFDYLRPEALLQEIDELRRANRVKVNRDRVKILNRTRIKASCDIPLVATDVPNCSATFAVLLIGRFSEGRCPGSDRAGIDFVHIRNVQVNRRRPRVKSWTTTNHHHRITNPDLAVKPTGRTSSAE